MAKHHAIEDTVGRARHYGAIATDALALVPPSEIKTALEEAVAFCIAPRALARTARATAITVSAE